MRTVSIVSFVLALGVPMASGCGGSNAGYRGFDRPHLDLDVQGTWDDPEADYGKMKPYRPGGEAAPGDPRVNDRAPVLVIQGATVLTAAGTRIEKGTVILKNGRIDQVIDQSGQGGDGRTETPGDARVIDGTGKFVTPGLIDSHSHVGVYAVPRVRAHSDGNEVVAPTTAYARAESGYWPQDPAITRLVAGGVTTALILPGSANLIGGAGFTAVLRPGRSADEVRFPRAPRTIKMACGENPKRVYGDKGGPFTRMGVYAGFRAAFRQAAEYNVRLMAYRRQRAVWLEQRSRAAELDGKAASEGKSKRVKVLDAPKPPERDFALETLAAVLRGEVLVQIHCYRAGEMREMVAISEEFGFQIRSFHHALEAYKVRDILAARDIAINTWVDWWGFKMEAFDGIPENAPLFTEAGGRAVIHSDSGILAQRLNQEAAKAMFQARHAGIVISEDQALRWVTANPAWVLGIDEVTGTLEAGKRADVVIWNRHPFSVYAKAEVVIQGGDVVYERALGRPLTDFELGNSAAATGGQERGVVR